MTAKTAVKPEEPGRGRRAQRNAAWRHRIDRCEHHRSDQARARALSGRGRQREYQRCRAGRDCPRGRRALRCGRRPGCLSRTQERVVRHPASRLAAGESAVVEAAQRPAQWVIGAITGAAGLRPTLAAAERGAIVALANKETLVCAGGLFMRRAAASGCDRAAGRFRAQRAVSGDGRRTARGCASRDPDGVGWTVPHLDRGSRFAARRWSRRSSIRTGRWARR